MKRFRIAESDIIKAYAKGTKGLLTSTYNSGFHSIDSVIGELNRKIPYYGGNVIEYHIVNETKETSKTIIKKVNQ